MSGFMIKGGNSDFLNKQKNIFDVLNTAEKDVKTSCDNDPFGEVEKGESRKRKRKETKGFRGKESLFKIPQEPPLRNRTPKTPDFQRNPHRWVKYSLGDVTAEEMSNESNTAVALAFLKTVKRQKETVSAKMEVDDTEEGHDDKFVCSVKHEYKTSFVKPKRPSYGEPVSSVVELPEDKPIFKNSKLLMPEYVVGQKKKSSRKGDNNSMIPASEGSGKPVQLSHLQEYEDE